MIAVSCVMVAAIGGRRDHFVLPGCQVGVRSHQWARVRSRVDLARGHHSPISKLRRLRMPSNTAPTVSTIEAMTAEATDSRGIVEVAIGDRDERVAGADRGPADRDPTQRVEQVADDRLPHEHVDEPDD